MSQEMILGSVKKLSKLEFGSSEIFKINKKYKDDFFFQEGLELDLNLDKKEKNILSNYDKKYNWYIVKSRVNPLSAATRYAEDLPGLYAAACQVSNWFKEFVANQINIGNELAVVNIWYGNEINPKNPQKERLNLSKIDLNNFELPRFTLYELEI